MMTCRTLFAILLAVGFADGAFAAPETEMAPASRIMHRSRRGVDWWGERCARNRDFIAAHEGKVDFVFAGSSSTHFWETAGAKSWATLTNRYTILNAGYGGDTTHNLLWRFRYGGELDGYRAKAVVLQIGSNDNGVSGADPTNTFRRICVCIDEFRRHQPEAKVVLLGFAPRAVGTRDGDPTKDNGANARNYETNRLLKTLADGRDVFYLDCYDKFLVDGKIPKALSDDYIHPTDKGYALIRAALEPLLARLAAL